MTAKNKQLYDLMRDTGYPREFSELICRELATEFTAGRMYGYIRARGLLPLEEVANEMLAILSDRDRLMEKHATEYAQGKINEYYRTREEE